MRSHLVITVLGAFILGALAGAGGSSDIEPTANVASSEEEEDVADDEPEPTFEEEEELEPPPPPAPDPKADYSHTCDYLLGDFSESPTGYRFVADAKIENTGNIGVEAKVTAIWQQAGAPAIKSEKTVEIPAGGRKRVRFTEVATQDQIDLHQSLGYGKLCRVKVTLLDTFGSVSP